jgi:general secretion pathway protein L
MIKVNKEIKLFGLDLSIFWQELVFAFRQMLDWPVLSALKAQAPVALLDEKGQWLIYKTPSAKPVQADAKKAQKIKFQAVALPSDIVLEHAFSLPQLERPEALRAISLEARRISPFAPDQTLWVIAPSTIQAHSKTRIFLTSKTHVQDYLGKLKTDAKFAKPLDQIEVWIKDKTQAPAVLQGYGETRRHRYEKLQKLLLGGVLLLVGALVVAHLLTPTLQLRLRAIDAVQQYQVLSAKTTPLLQQRDDVLKKKEQVAFIEQINGNPAHILETFDLITKTLPDDAYLQSLQILPSETDKAIKVSMSGQANNAAELMQRLGEHPSLRDVKAPAAATKPPGASKETFVIEFLLLPASPQQTSAFK